MVPAVVSAVRCSDIGGNRSLLCSFRRVCRSSCFLANEELRRSLCWCLQEKSGAGVKFGAWRESLRAVTFCSPGQRARLR